MQDNIKNKNIFVAFVGYGIHYSELQYELSKQNEKLFGRKFFPNCLHLRENVILGQLINTEFESDNLPHIYLDDSISLNNQHSMVSIMTIIDDSSKDNRNSIVYVADYDYEELRNAFINSKDFETGDVKETYYSPYLANNASFHDFVPQIMKKYKNNWFGYLQNLNLNVTYVFYDTKSNTLSALKIGNASNLYFGHAKITDEILISNNDKIVQQFCYDMFEIDYDCYFKDGKFYNVDKKNNKRLSLTKK